MTWCNFGVHNLVGCHYISQFQNIYAIFAVKQRQRQMTL